MKRRDELLAEADEHLPDAAPAKSIKAEHVRGRLKDLAESAVMRSSAIPHIFDFIPGGQHSAILGQTSTFDCQEALQDAIDALPARGGAIHIGPGLFNLGDTLHLKKRVHLIGEGGGQAGGATSLIKVAKDKAGLVFHRHNTGPDGIETSGPESDGSIIEGLAIYGSGTEASAHGIRMRARATIRDCVIGGFGGDGIHIAAAFNGDDAMMGNANNWQIERVRVSNNGGHGVYVDGADANAGVGAAIDVSSNKGWGIYDSSFLGNTWVGCHAAHNELGPYKTDNDNARSVFLGCYSESGGPAASLAQYTVALGGLHAAGVVGGFHLLDNAFNTTNIRVASDDRTMTLRLGNAGAFLEMGVQGDGQGWGVTWSESSGTVQFRWHRLDSYVPLRLTTQLSDFRGEDDENIGPGKLLMQGAWARRSNGRYRFANFEDMLNRIEALEALHPSD